jgi:hypothetical protein
VEFAWAGVLLMLLPVSARGLGRRLAHERPARMDFYLSAAASHLLLLAPTLAVDFFAGRGGIAFLLHGLAPERFALWTLATLAACAAVWLLMLLETKRGRAQGDEVALAMLPRTPRERLAFSGVSLSAGFVEEYLLRGFCLGAVLVASGSMVAAVAVTTVSFGLAHLYQGWRGTAGAMLLGAILAVPVAVTGSLLPSIIAHAATDLLSGFCALPMLRAWRVPIE